VDHLSVEGDGDIVPTLSAVAQGDLIGVEVTLGDTAWQRVVLSDRWRWQCASELRLLYRTPQRTTMQLVLEDSDASPSFPTGARWFWETQTEVGDPVEWQDWRLPLSESVAFDKDDPRELDLRRLRRIAVAFPAPSSDQRITLAMVGAVASEADLDEEGSCL
jgi:hypothetical protein